MSCDVILIFSSFILCAGFFGFLRFFLPAINFGLEFAPVGAAHVFLVSGVFERLYFGDFESEISENFEERGIIAIAIVISDSITQHALKGMNIEEPVMPL